MRARIFALAFIASLVTGTAWADNTSAGGAYSLVPGGTPSEAYLNTTSTERWYSFTAFAGRSYCAETQGGVFFDTSSTAGQIDTIVTVYRADTTTAIVINDDMGQEPRGFRLSLAFYIATATEINYIKVVRFDPAAAFSIRTRIAETTLFSNWFFVGGDYSAFTLIRNTTNTSLSYTINWRNAAGTIVATTSSTIAGNGSTALDARAFVTTVVSGTVEIVHNSAPDAIMATTTVLSGTTGLSFDTFFVKRASW